MEKLTLTTKQYRMKLIKSNLQQDVLENDDYCISTDSIVVAKLFIW